METNNTTQLTPAAKLEHKTMNGHLHLGSYTVESRKNSTGISTIWDKETDLDAIVSIHKIGLVQNLEIMRNSPY